MLHLGTHGHHCGLREVLIVKIAAIGDVVMTLPLLPLLHKKYPGVKITWICGKIAAPLVAATHLVDQLIEVEDQALFRGNVWNKGCAVLKAWKRLLGKRFDLILTAHPDPRFRLLSAVARGGQRRVYQSLAGRSRTDEYIRMLFPEKLGQESCATFPEVECSLPQQLEPLIQDAPIALAPGGAKNLLREDALRRWPIEHYVEVAKKLLEHNLPVLLIGAESDAWVRPYFSSLPVIDGIGKTTLTDLVALLKRCRFLLTHDTGSLHLAKLARCKTLALFGPTHPREFGVFGEHIWGGESLACAPCYDGKNYAPCTNNLCMKNILPARVLKKIKEMV